MKLKKMNEKIKILREQNGWSQAELAEKLGVHATHISRLEGGRYTPSLDLVMKMVRLFKISYDYILDEDWDKTVSTEDKSLVERLRLMETLDKEDKQVLIKVIDAMLTKKRMFELLTDQEVLVKGKR